MRIAVVAPEVGARQRGRLARDLLSAHPACRAPLSHERGAGSRFLGPEQEALDVAHRLADRLRWSEVAVRIGVGPTLPVAQLALLTCPASQRIALVSSSDLSAFSQATAYCRALRTQPASPHHRGDCAAPAARRHQDAWPACAFG